MGQLIDVTFESIRKTAETVSEQPGWLPPPGKYQWRTVSAEVGVSEKGGPVVKFVFECLTGPNGAVENRGKKLKNTMSYQANALYSLAGLVRACGISGSDAAKLDTDMFIGKSFYSSIRHQDYNGRPSYKMEYFTASNGATA